MRIQNSLRNIKYNLLFFIISGIFAFYSRKVLLQCLGYEIVGMDSLFFNLLGFLNVAELGITSAITFSLYKPLMEKDFDRVNSILITYKYVYRIIAAIITIGVLVLCFFIRRFVNQDTVSINMIRFYFILSSIVPITSYLLTHTQVILYVNQEGYILSKFLGIFRTLKALFQVILVYYTLSYTLWLILDIIFNLIAYFIINNVIKIRFSWIDQRRQKTIRELIIENKKIFLNTRDLFFHKLSGIVLLQTDNLIISAFTTLKNVTIYSSYIMITNLIIGVFNQVLNGLSPSIGNLVAENNNEKTYKTWKEIFVIISISIGIICYCVYKLINDLIELWIGKEYLLDKITVLYIIVNLYFSLLRKPTDAFKDGYGIFGDKWAPIFESTLNLIVSIILVQKLGIAGVVMGTIISNALIILIWKPYILFKDGFKRNIINFYVVFLKIILTSGISFFISNQICSSLYKFIVGTNLINFVLKTLITLISSSTTSIILSLLISDFKKIIFKYFSLLKNNYLKLNHAQFTLSEGDYIYERKR
jgi:O-antigen/teichoic acid export membrane protein